MSPYPDFNDPNTQKVTKVFASRNGNIRGATAIHVYLHPSLMEYAETNSDHKNLDKLYTECLEILGLTEKDYQAYKGDDHFKIFVDDHNADRVLNLLLNRSGISISDQFEKIFRDYPPKSMSPKASELLARRAKKPFI